MMREIWVPSDACAVNPVKLSPLPDAALIEECRRRSVALLRENQSPHGVLAARANPQSRERGYTAIFGRDAAICAIGMALSGDAELERLAPLSLETLAAYQAPNGQIPKFVDMERQEADFWYLGCIDATLWWLLALDFLDRRYPALGLRAGHAQQIALGLAWLNAQEHQRFFLLQQNEASDWADIMPRSGFVLYSNALWYDVKRRYGQPQLAETLANFSQLFFPFSGDNAEYRRARLLAGYAIDQANHRDLYLSFVNFSFFGDEGDVFGNLLTVLLGLTDAAATSRVLDALAARGVADPFPVRVVCEPILQASFLWRPYMSRHEQNFAWQYHNGGIWPFVGGFWVCALAAAGRTEEGWAALAAVARANALDQWRFTEWLHGQSHAASGMEGQSWNAAAFLIAHRALQVGVAPFAAPLPP
ncbi:MAG: glycoside hydrolase [Betaproteobacteria bacterium]|nr:glycoside hydrolase [Betaproteobacteria bacterium]